MNASRMELSVTIVDHPASQRDQARHDEAEHDAEASAHKGNQHGLDHELANDVGLARTDGAANADFARALENAGQHDVHDADAADQKGNGGDRNHDGVE